ncbi:hypothetical protein UF75_3203 [Desulfosporosinus sp. I2]|nr:hypothetical protein UF75_3203 [Desulfosporosinus sp. I2]
MIVDWTMFRREGKWMHYSLNSESIQKMKQILGNEMEEEA